jgi:hypothetical protein
MAIFLMLFFMEAFISAVICGALMVLSLPYHAVVFFAFRRMTNYSVIWKALFLLPAVLLVGNVLYGSLPAVAAQTVLSRCELSPLPKSAQGVRVGCVSHGIGGKRLLKFRANQEEIEHFLDASPGLRGHECKRFSKEKMRLARRKSEQTAIARQNSNHEYFSPDSTVPAWYSEEIRGRGKYYRIADKGVEVIVDDEKNVVFVSTSRSFM